MRSIEHLHLLYLQHLHCGLAYIVIHISSGSIADIENPDIARVVLLELCWIVSPSNT